MKIETKAKLQSAWGKFKGFCKDWGLPILGFATIGAAWDGHIKATRLEKALAETQDVVINNAKEQIKDRAKLLDLEHQQTLLFEKALQVTEGKAE